MTEKKVLTDGNHVIELHHLSGSGHNEGLLVAYWIVKDPRPGATYWLWLLIPLAGQVWAAARHAEKLASSLTVTDGRIRYESGMMSRTTRTLELSKIQDVRIDQTPLQRVLNLGDLSLETAGESGRLTMPSIDRPRAVSALTTA